MTDEDRYTEALVYLIDNVPELAKALEAELTRLVADLGPYMAALQDALWQHVPSCPCFRCEDFRWHNGLTCMYGVGPRPDWSPEHNWQGQVVFAGLNQDPPENFQVDSADSGGETKHPTSRDS